MTQTTYIICIPTNQQDLYIKIIGNDNYILGINFSKEELQTSDNLPAHMSLCKQELEEYLAKKRTIFTSQKHFLYLSGSSTDLSPTEFQQKVWQELLNVPYGLTKTYADIAKAIGNDKACRAVGTANGKNPYCIIIPCHRIVAKDSLGGYTGGLHIKEWLLSLEKSAK